MKKSYLQKLSMMVITSCISLSLLCSCNASKKIAYYSQIGGYISVSGTVSNVKYNEDTTALYIDLSELSPVLDDTCFKIIGENLNVVRANSIDNKLKIGEQITIITAPKYFGDGYVMPIVAISIGDEKFLEFEEGYKNLLDWLSESNN